MNCLVLARKALSALAFSGRRRGALYVFGQQHRLSSQDSTQNQYNKVRHSCSSGDRAVLERCRPNDQFYAIIFGRNHDHISGNDAFQRALECQRLPRATLEMHARPNSATRFIACTTLSCEKWTTLSIAPMGSLRRFGFGAAPTTTSSVYGLTATPAVPNHARGSDFVPIA